MVAEIHNWIGTSQKITSHVTICVIYFIAQDISLDYFKYTTEQILKLGLCNWQLAIDALSTLKNKYKKRYSHQK